MRQISSTAFDQSIIYSHTGIRGIAAMSVFLMHIYRMHSTAAWNLDQRLFQFFEWGDYAVDLFFILSGFILNWVYLDSKGKLLNWSSYFRARVARIMPLYYVTSIASIPALYISYLKHGSEYIHIGSHNYILVGILNLLMFSGFLGMPTFNGPGWSISVEFFCYVFVFPLLVWVGKSLVLKRYALATQILFVILLITCLLISYQIPLIHFYRWDWDSHFLARGVFGFSAGFLICTIYRTSYCKPKAGLINLIIFSVVAVFLLTQLHYLTGYFLLLALPLLVYFTAFDKGVAASILKLNMFQWLGERSYSIYLWHYPVLSLYPDLSKWICNRIFKSSAYFGLLNCIALVFIVLFISELSYHFFELPCREYIRNLRRQQSGT